MTTNEFADYVEKRGSMIVTNDSLVFINRSIETNLSDQIINYENSILEKKYSEFRYLMNEFHDGILLFEISGKKVWNKVSEDSLGLHRYYEDHKTGHMSHKGIAGKIYTLKSKTDEKALLPAYIKYSKKPETDKYLAGIFNKKNDTLLTINEGIWFKGDDKEIDSLQWVTGFQPFHKNGFPSIIVIDKIIDQAPLKFNEVQGEMISGYQEFLESGWIKQLKEKYTVKIDSLVLEEVKMKLKNE